MKKDTFWGLSLIAFFSFALWFGRGAFDRLPLKDLWIPASGAVVSCLVWLFISYFEYRDSDKYINDQKDRYNR
jgi:hypothetical protein